MILLTMAPWLFNQMVNQNIIRSLDDHSQKVDFFDVVDFNLKRSNQPSVKMQQLQIERLD